MTNIFSVVSLHRNSTLNSNDCLYNVTMCNKWIFIYSYHVSSLFSRPGMSDSDCVDCSTSGLPVTHHLPLFVQVRWWCHPAISSSDASSPSAPNLSQHQGLSQWVGCLHQVTKILEHQLQHHSFQWVFRVDFPYSWLVWSPCCTRDFQKSSLAPQFEGNNSLALCLLYGPGLTTVCDHWEDQSLDYTDFCWQSSVSAFQHTA